jgi:starch phosphorylase
VFHTNEGHAGFLGVERIGELVAAGLSFDEAKEAVRAEHRLTTHTPVPAGIDRFPRELIARYFGSVGRRRGASRASPSTHPRPAGDAADPSVFNMAHMGCAGAARQRA